MKISFKEIYYNNGIKTPLLEIEYDLNSSIDNINSILDYNDSLYLDINNGCLDNFNIMNVIEEIFSIFNIDYIDRYTWEKFLDYRNHKKGTKMVYLCPEPYIMLENDKFKNLDSYKPNILKNLNIEIIKNIFTNCSKVIAYETNFSNDEEYCYYLLNILFNCSFNFKIKKCMQCNKPFITNNQNFQTCSRVFKNNITCNKYYEKIRKQHQYDDPIKHLIKNVRDKYKNDIYIDKLNEFNKELLIKKEQHFNDNKSLINWILNTYYTEKGKENIIKRLGLSKYL